MAFVDSIMAWGTESLLRLPAMFWSALPYTGAALGVAAGAASTTRMAIRWTTR
jgi:hypothetical protein